MNTKALHTLEFDKIIELLEPQTTCDSGRILAGDLTPSDDLEKIELMQEQTADAFSRIVKNGDISFAGVCPVKDHLSRLAIGGVLNTSELLELCSLMEASSHAKNYGRPKRDDEPSDSLTAFFNTLEPMQHLSQEIRRCIISEDELSDDASPALRHIRQEINQNNDKIHSTLNSILNGAGRSYLQESVITMRNGRYCLPVKAEYKSQINGMVHDQSQSGMTLFIEPMAVVKLNNDLRELYAKEQEEINVILGHLSQMTAEHSGFIKQNFEILTELDFIMARGRLALSMNASRPEFNKNGYINIKKGRHPLLNASKVVPIDIELGKDFSLLVVTGPNTGGKTVSLKTVGLFVLMGEAGLHIPAMDHSELSVFPDVYADIGDEQSIEQSLSTFSGHMKNIVEILKTVREDSLVLFDELGAGTDPTEGAALAISILSKLHEQNIRCIATTHYSELKVYALTTPGVCNASCEFNVETLMPTYRILVGVPGKSNAFAISSKLGLPDPIIENAKERLSASDISFEDLLTDLESDRLRTEKELDLARNSRREAENLKKEYEQKLNDLNSRADSIIDKARSQASSLLQEAKDYADETMKNFRKFGKENASSSEMEKEREKLRKKMTAVRSTQKPIGDTAPKKEHKPEEFKVGDTVKVHSMNVKGIVQTTADAKGHLYVQMGVIRSKVHYTDLTILMDEDPLRSYKQPGKNGNKNNSGSIKMSKSLTVANEIVLLGMTVDEAIAVLDKYLDDAFLAHLPSVRIVHGKGTGALRNAVSQYLRRNKHVKSFRAGAFGEGDAGVTIAEFTTSDPNS